LGPWLAALFPVVLSLAVMPSWGPALIVLGYIALLEISIANFLEPWLYGRTTGISEVALLIAITFWTWIWGPIGLILATPLTTCLVVLGRHVSQLEFFNHLLGDEPVLETHVAFYQRLLARDPDEATEVVEDYLKKHSVEKICDDVLVPALLVAK